MKIKKHVRGGGLCLCRVRGPAGDHGGCRQRPVHGGGCERYRVFGIPDTILVAASATSQVVMG